MLIIIGIIGMIASLIWEILAGGDETVIVSVYTTAMVIIGFLWNNEQVDLPVRAIS
ncbi:MAG: hypothetical protein ACXQTS_06970 [Candidatus Methanospirareceae archaeon]